MNTARCTSCNSVVRLPHARSRASHARCEECHRRAAGRAPDAAVMRACELDPPWKLAEQNAPDPDSPLRAPITPAGRVAGANRMLRDGKITRPSELPGHRERREHVRDGPRVDA